MNTKYFLLQNISNDVFDVFDLNLYSIFHSAAHQLTLMMEAQRGSKMTLSLTMMERNSILMIHIQTYIKTIKLQDVDDMLSKLSFSMSRKFHYENIQLSLCLRFFVCRFQCQMKFQSLSSKGYRNSYLHFYFELTFVQPFFLVSCKAPEPRKGESAIIGFLFCFEGQPKKGHNGNSGGVLELPCSVFADLFEAHGLCSSGYEIVLRR